jgi:ABC-type thiamin/hydroxymethylpyrimidine transport system permease subunit
MKTDRYYYSTRDLLLMAALAALGGISSTYINFIGDFFQSFLGFAGTTQWAAGLHVLWLILAVGLTKKTGAGTITGLIKGGVELFSGNTHGLLVLLVDLVAGILVDLGLLPFRKKDHWLTYALAGGLASASNVLVFQLFAAVPADILTYGLIGLIALVAFISGVVFAGILGAGLLATMRRTGVVKDHQVQPLGKKARLIMFLSVFFLTAGLFGYLKIARAAGGTVSISGAVNSPYEFVPDRVDVEEQALASDANGITSSYQGFPLSNILEAAYPEIGADLVLLRASDGYTFFITFEELETNPGIGLQVQGKGKNRTFNVVGPQSKKAWVNGLDEIQVIRSVPLEILVQGQKYSFVFSDWVENMDSAFLDLGDGPAKYQGLPLSALIDEVDQDVEEGEVWIESTTGERWSLTLEEIRADDGIRVFLDLGQGRVDYALAHLDGEVYLTQVERISVP